MTESLFLNEMCASRATTLMRAATRGVRDTKDAAALFRLIDSNRNGRIERSELVSLLTVTKRPLSAQELHVLLGEAPLDFAAFVEVLRHHADLVSRLQGAYRVIFVAGGPGSGKGTVCTRVAAALPQVIRHVSCGDLLRDEVARNTELGRHIAALIASGALVSASVVLALLDARLAQSASHVVLLDGFPRSADNVTDFYASFGAPSAMWVFDCPETVMVQRIVARGRSSGRADDNEATAHRRIQVFREQSTAPLALLRARGVPEVRIDSTLDIDANVRRLVHEFD